MGDRASVGAVELRPLGPESLATASDLLGPEVAPVAEEKLFGDSPHGRGDVIGAWEGPRLVGLTVVCRRWLRILAVAPTEHGRGIGSRLLAEAERRSAGRLIVAGQPGNYLWPGIDETDAATLGFFRSRGYEITGSAENLVIPFPPPAPRPSPEGYDVRVATAADAGELSRWIGTAFSASWAFEVGRALEVGGVHVATRDGTIVAFAAHDGNNRGLGWFGPAGTHPAHRGHGLGAVLLLHSLADVAAAGHARGVVAWSGPRAFYEKTARAVVDRRFVLLERELT
jgi:mycothiol synthase